MYWLRVASLGSHDGHEPSARCSVRRPEPCPTTLAQKLALKTCAAPPVHFRLPETLVRLCVPAYVTGVELDVTHAPGEKNRNADFFLFGAMNLCHY